MNRAAEQSLPLLNRAICIVVSGSLRAALTALRITDAGRNLTPPAG